MVGEQLFFSATGVEGAELWKTDGTAAGTKLVKDIFPGPNGSSPYGLNAVGCTLFFFAYDGIHGTELWKSDGTEAGTTLVKDIDPRTVPGAAGDKPFRFGEVVLFDASDGVNGPRLWRSDGSAEGTVLVHDSSGGLGPFDPYGFLEMDGYVYFFARGPQRPWRLWRTDGTGAGTAAITDQAPGWDDYPHDLVAMKGTLYFSASDGVSGEELWTSDGTAAGTHRLVDINPGAAHGMPIFLTPVDGLLYFGADDGVHGHELWQSDGTAAGTSLLSDVTPGPGESAIGRPIASAGRLYFSAFEPTVGQELWSIPLPSVAGDFHVVTPCRVFDSRDPSGPAGGPSLRVGLPRSFPVAKTCGVPIDARAIVGNLTVVNGTARGDLSIGASDQSASRAAALPFQPGRARANNVIAKLGSTGAVSLELASPDCGAQADAILDVSGYFR